MKDEIKEILDRLDAEEFELPEYSSPISWIEMFKIRDYITNLQEENKRLKEERQNINNRNYNQKIANRKLMEDIEKLRTNLKTNKRRRKKQTHKKNIYKSRNEKAIEFMKENCDIITLNNGWIIRSELTTTGLGKLFKILNGGDDNE